MRRKVCSVDCSSCMLTERLRIGSGRPSGFFTVLRCRASQRGSESGMSSSATSRFPTLPLAEMKPPRVDARPHDLAASTDLTDEALMARIREDDKEALALLFRRYVGLVRSVGRRIIRNDAEAEDLVQEVFLYLYRKRTVYDSSKSSARSWIVQMAYRPPEEPPSKHTEGRTITNRKEIVYCPQRRRARQGQRHKKQSWVRGVTIKRMQGTPNYSLNSSGGKVLFDCRKNRWLVWGRAKTTLGRGQEKHRSTFYEKYREGTVETCAQVAYRNGRPTQRTRL